MQTRRIGELKVSTVGLGCNNFGRLMDETAVQQVVAAAVEAGINLFDTADIYGSGQSEVLLGKALGPRRKHVHIASKFGFNQARGGGAKAYVRQACDASLMRLNTEYIDLLYFHRPDPATPIAETLDAMLQLKQAGKVREIACSNFSTTQLHEAQASGLGQGFVAVQNEYSLLERSPEQGLLDLCSTQKVAFVPYFPLKSGLLTGKYRPGRLPQSGRLTSAKGGVFEGMAKSLLTDTNLALVEHLAHFAEERGHTLLDLAFSWLLMRPQVASVIAGATKPAQVVGNVAAAAWELSAADMAQVDSILSRPAHP